MNDVSTNLLLAQQLYAAALSQGSIDTPTFTTGANTLSQVRLDTGDARDIIRIAGPSDVITQNITFVAAEIGTFPGLLGKTNPLNTSLTSLVTSMQASLGTASSLVAGSTCPASVP